MSTSKELYYITHIPDAESLGKSYFSPHLFKLTKAIPCIIEFNNDGTPSLGFETFSIEIKNNDLKLREYNVLKELPTHRYDISKEFYESTKSILESYFILLSSILDPLSSKFSDTPTNEDGELTYIGIDTTTDFSGPQHYTEYFGTIENYILKPKFSIDTDNFILHGYSANNQQFIELDVDTKLKYVTFSWEQAPLDAIKVLTEDAFRCIYEFYKSLKNKKTMAPEWTKNRRFG